MKEVLVLRNLECIKSIVHPRRIDILKTFDKSPLSAKQLSELLNEPHAKINYHIKTLYKVGILELVEEKVKSGIVEKYYYPTAKNIVIDKKAINYSLDEDDKNEGLSISEFENISEMLYEAAEENILEEDSVINYNDIYFGEDEIKELNNTIKLKVEEILNKRKSTMNDLKYNLAILSIPLTKKEEYNIS